MARGLECRASFRDDRDRADFVRRLAALAAARAWTVFAWALLPHPVHLLVRTGRRPLAAAMRALLTGYAGATTAAAISSRPVTSPSSWRRSPLSSSGCATSTATPCARVVVDLRALDRYPWAGHAALVGRRAVPWQDREAVWGRFARPRRPPRATGPSWQKESPRAAAPTSRGAGSCGARAAGRGFAPCAGAGRPTGGMNGSWGAPPSWRR